VGLLVEKRIGAVLILGADRRVVGIRAKGYSAEAALLIFYFAKTIGSAPQPSSLPAPWDAQPRGRHRL
jgi:hypothetical protein